MKKRKLHQFFSNEKIWVYSYPVVRTDVMLPNSFAEITLFLKKGKKLLLTPTGENGFLPAANERIYL